MRKIPPLIGFCQLIPMAVNQRHYAKNDECCTGNFSFVLLEIKKNAQNTLNTEPREVGHGGQ